MHIRNKRSKRKYKGIKIERTKDTGEIKENEDGTDGFCYDNKTIEY